MSNEASNGMRDIQAVNRDLALGQLRELIAAARPSSVAFIEPGALLTGDLGIDSLAMVEIVIGIEERFGISTGNFEDLEREALHRMVARALRPGGRLLISDCYFPTQRRGAVRSEATDYILGRALS